MAIKIVSGESIKVENLVITIYGQPNIGKTTLGFTAKNPILFDFDGGSYRAGNSTGKSVVPIENWNDVEDLDHNDLQEYSTIVIDTAGSCIDMMINSIIKTNKKLAVNGNMTLQGYGQLKAKFKLWINNLKSYNKDIVLITHSNEEQREEKTVERIYATGSSRQEIYQQSDLIGQYKFKDGTRVLSFDPSGSTYGKNIGLPDRTILSAERNPNVMEEIFFSAKTLINQSADQNQKEHERLKKLRSDLESLDKDPEEFNNRISSMVENNAGPVDRHIIVEIGTSKGLEFSRETKLFSIPVSEESTDPEESPDSEEQHPF